MLNVDKIKRVAAVVALVLVAGCTSSNESTIEGQVFLDGKPLEKGAVRFSPLDGQAQTAGAAIQDGKFSMKATPAKYRVEISATAVQGAGPGRINKYAANDNLTVVSLIPERYNTQSELTMEVKAGRNEQTFNLTSK